MYRLFSLAFLVGGVALVILGIGASQSVASDISRLFTGSPTGKALWTQVGGVTLCAIGVVGLLYERSGAMLYYALIFLVVAIVAGVFGFTNIAGTAVGIAQALFFIFLIMSVIALVTHSRRRI